MTQPPADLAPRQKPFGLVEWFRIGERARVERALDGMLRVGATSLRTQLSWAEYHEAGGEAWYDWLIPTLGARIDLLPCVHYTPPSLSRNGRTSGAPRRLRDYADFIDLLLTRHGRHFRQIELWNEPNNLLDWDWRADQDWQLFCEMIGAAAYWAEKRGWKAVLGGLCPFDPHWLRLMGERGVLGVVSAVGLHGFPGTWDSEAGLWPGWAAQAEALRVLLDSYNPKAEIWITEAGYSTWRHDEPTQVRRFLDALAAPVERLYWYGWQDLPRDLPVQEGPQFDPRHYHLGLVDAEERPKLLCRLLGEGGVAKAAETVALGAPALRRPGAPVAVVGGAGFIGSNLADSFLAEGREVLILDNLSRPGVERNLDWLRSRHGGRVHPLLADLRDRGALDAALADAGAVFHLAAQVAVTTSLEHPAEDFAVNAQGTLNLLEALRRSGRRVPVIFASTNKVYGALEDRPMAELDDRYVPLDGALRAHGVDESHPLDFCTPYGCSKGVADQYVLDYAKSYDLPTAVLRMSCVYGPRQFGTEDQGWVAHFLIRALRGEPLTIYGNGKQVRDVLHVADAVRAYRALLDAIERVKGQAFNLGGGAHNAISLRMALREIGRLLGREVPRSYEGWRKGDQFYFVADTRKLRKAVGWNAAIGWREGLADLAAWLRQGDARPAPVETTSVETRRLMA